MRAGRPAWGLCGVALLLTALGFVFMLLNRSEPGGTVFGRWQENAALALVFPVVGALIAANRPRNPIGWILIAAGMSGAVVLLSSEYALYAVFTRPDALPGGAVMAWVSAWAGAVAFGIMFTFLFLLFPDGRLPSPRWRPVAWLAGVTLTTVTLATGLKPKLIDEGGEALPNGAPSQIRNPFGLEGAGPALTAVESSAVIVFVVFCALPAAVSLILRYRRSTGDQRQQIKWLAYAAGLLVAGVVVPDLMRAVWGETTTVFVISELAEVVPFLAIAIATGVAILRHRLYDIDIVINRTLVYGALSATLVGAYLGSVLVFRFVLSPLTGTSDLAVAGSTLAVAAMFRPLRSRIQSLVDRRFYRARYDAVRTLEEFSQHLRDELDLEALGTDLRQVVGETMAPSHVSLWMRGASR